MDRYEKFENFMIDVIEAADAKCNKRYSKSLENLYQVTESIVGGLKLILSVFGWHGFVAVVALLALGPTLFGVSLTSFSLTPMGWAIIAGLSVSGGALFIGLLYKNKKLPVAIKEVGSFYKSNYERYRIKGDRRSIDSLLDEASDDLVSRALDSLGITG